MSCQVVRLLQGEELDSVVSFISGQTFSDGRATALGRARDVKNNLQIPRTGVELTGADRTLLSALQRNRLFLDFAYPRRIIPPIFSRYDPGMQYGSHVDNAIMLGPDGNPFRSDIAITVFLSAPGSYDGGELVIDLPVGQQEIKLDAGEAVAYPASSIHHVNPVTRGMRLAAITWVQSMVGDDRLRAILHDLTRAMAAPGVAGDPELSLLLAKTYHNLLRYAAQP